MKVLIESYNMAAQNVSGGVQIKIRNLVHHLNKNKIEAHFFNKWEDKVTDFNILHIFKLNIEDYHLMNYAKNIGTPVVISSIVNIEKKMQIKANQFLSKFLPIHTGYAIMEDMLNTADAIIAETQKEAEFIAKNYMIKEKKIHIIPNGVNIHVTHGDPKFIQDIIKADREIILQVGRFDRNKNQLNVIRAMKNSNIPVVFIGGPDAAQIDYFKQCKFEATDNMHFLGWLKNDDPLLSSAYANARVVVLPSYKETFGISLIEGGAVGANLVATRELPIVEWGLSEYCLGIDPQDKTDIQRTLIQAYNNPRNPLLSEIIKNKFSSDVVAKQHIEIYTNIIK